jgi:transposase
LTESALRRWVKQAQIDQQRDSQGQLTSSERKELNELRRDLKRVRLERDFLTAGALSGGTPPTHCLKKAATFFAKESSDPMS